MNGKESHSASKARAGRQYCCTHLSIAASNEEGVAVVAFVGIGISLVEV